MHVESLGYWKISCTTSEATDIHKFTDPWQCLSLCVFIFSPLLSIHFSPAMTGGSGRQWQGSLHHKTSAGHCPQQLPHKITDTLSTSKWTGPVWHTADAGRVRGKCRMAEREESQKKWEERGVMRQKGRRNRNKAPNGRPEFNPGSKPQLFSLDTLDICVSMTQIMFAWTLKDCRKSKVRPAWWMLHWWVPPPSVFCTPQRPGAYQWTSQGRRGGRGGVNQ